MKTKSLFIAALVIMSAVISAVGKDEPTSKAGLAIVPVKGSETFKVIYKGENSGRVKLTIYNDEKSVIFSESISTTDGFIRPLNFKGLAFGEYTIELVDATGKRTEKINFTEQVRSTSKSIIRVAKLTENNKFLLAIANSTSNTISVKIFNNDNQLIHAETKTITGDYAQLYSVTNSDGVVFEVSDNAGNVQVIRY
jgi:hypothetical protein